MEFGIYKKDKYEVEGNDQQENLIFACHCNFDSARVWNVLFPFPCNYPYAITISTMLLMGHFPVSCFHCQPSLPQQGSH